MNELTKEQSLASVIIAVIIAIAGGFVYSGSPCDNRDRAKNLHDPPVLMMRDRREAEQKNTVSGNKEKIPATVYICGEVCNPGVYRLPPGSIKVRAVEAAGGATAHADLNGINLAEDLKNGEMIRIPGRDEGRRYSGDHHAEGPAFLNINTISAGDLQRHLGIGEKAAERIITFRQEKGSFESLDDLTRIKGIRKSTIEKLKGRVTL